ncbi:MAG: type II secretion system F family protein [Nakamurella sp.]
MTNTTMVLGLAALWIGLFAAVIGAVGGQSRRLPADRLGVATSSGPNRLATVTARLSVRLEAGKRPDTGPSALRKALESAGLTQRPGDFLILVGGAALGSAALGLVISGVLLAVTGAVFVPLLAKLALGFLASRRRKAFADQLDDSLQLLAGSLRAGHNLLQGLDAVSREAEKPTSVEFARLVNETRVGQDLATALDEAAVRMRCQDFVWVAQAIAIHREVGGDLAEVLATVSHTIRERNQIRRQVGALSAEGKLSALVLMALPVGVTLFLMMTNATYLAPFTESLVGYGMIAAAGVLMLVGALWLRKVVSFKF